MKVVVCETEAREAHAFDSLRAQHDVTIVSEPITSANAGSFVDAEIVSTFINSRLDRAALDKLPSLRLIATRSTGYDHIDIDYCRSRAIAASNVPHYGENTVAEHVFALLLAISHRIPDAIERVQRGNFSPEGLEGFDLAGKTIGVIGTGSIGRHVVRIANGFGMKALAFDVRPDRHLEETSACRYMTLEELLSSSDIITLHVPARPDTQRLLSTDAFRLMKRGVVIINTARGDLIDTIALIQAMTNGTVAAVGLDVLPDEPMIREEAELISSAFFDQHDMRSLLANHVLLHMRNIVVTPHSAFNTREAVGRIITTTIENIQAFAAGTPQNVVNPTAARPNP